MTKEQKAQWLAALKSGNYKQAKHALRKNDSFCCLGVLCDITDNTKWAPAAYAEWTYATIEEGRAKTEAYSLPAALLTQWGLSTREMLELMWRNDALLTTDFTPTITYIEAMPTSD